MAVVDAAWSILLSQAPGNLVAPPPALTGPGPEIAGLLLSPGARVLALVWGLLWGSFCNVLVARIPDEDKNVVYPGSACGSCGTPIAWYDNIPIFSYLLLRGQCRHCGAKFSLRYLLVELIGGVLSFSLYLVHVIAPLVSGGGGLEDLLTWQLWFLLAMSLVVIVYIDLDWYFIPDEVVLPVGVVGLLAAVLRPEALGVQFWDALTAAIVGFALIFAVRWIYLKWRGIEAIGLGDAKFLFMAGAFFGVEGLMWTLGAGALQGLLVAIPTTLVGGRVGNADFHELHGDDPLVGEKDPDAGVMSEAVPFGPFLALAAMEYVLLGPQIRVLIGWLIGIPA